MGTAPVRRRGWCVLAVAVEWQLGGHVPLLGRDLRERDEAGVDRSRALRWLPPRVAAQQGQVVLEQLRQLVERHLYPAPGVGQRVAPLAEVGPRSFERG